jgi:predicted acylesterase/phospholipase RssA
LGTSAGSIMATMLAAGYNSREMADALSEKLGDQPVFTSFLQVPPAPSKVEIQNSDLRKMLREINLRFIPEKVEEQLDDSLAAALTGASISNRVFNFVEKGGLFAAQNFLDWIRNKLNSGIYNADRGAHKKGEPRRFGDMNLAEYHQATGADLSLVVSDITDSLMLVLNHRTAPECPVIWGVRMSMSVPLLWEEVIWQPAWGKYRGKDISGHAIVDGGMLSNFPIELFLSSQPQVTALMGKKTVGERQILGFLIDEKMEVPGNPQAGATPSSINIGELRMVSRISNMLNTLISAHDKSVIETFEQFVIRLPAKGYGTIEFGMSEEKRTALVTAGRQATAAYFDGQEAVSREETSFAPGPPAAESVTAVADRIATRRLFP